MSSTVASSSQRSPTIIKLAPSPRDVPSVGKLPSPRSFRSINSRTGSLLSQQSRSPGGPVSSSSSPPPPPPLPPPGLPISPRRNRSGRRNRVEEIAASALDLGPEMSTDKFGGAKKQQHEQQLVSSPKTPSSARQAQSLSANRSQNVSHPTAESSNPTLKTKATASPQPQAGTQRPKEQPPSAPASSSPQPPLGAPVTPETGSSKPSNPASKKSTRSKKMLVVDPKSGRKYHLHADDHSLTDKELHVYHRKAKASGPSLSTRRERSTEGSSRHTQQTQRTTCSLSDDVHTDAGTLDSFGGTFETASALTEVSYLGRYRFQSGPLSCIVPTTCTSIRHLAMGNGVEHAQGDADGHTVKQWGCGIVEERKEGRDDAETVERGRYKHLLEESSVNEGNNKTNNMNNKGMSSLPRIKHGAKRQLSVDTEHSTNSDNGGGRYDDGNNRVHGTESEAPPPVLLSPISALGLLLSPRISSLAGRFIDSGEGGSWVLGQMSPTGTGTGVEEVRFRRICLVVFPDEVRKCLEGTHLMGAEAGRNTKKTVGLLGMTFQQSGGDFQAHVSYVQRGSRAERMGVRKGDIVSFAVALSNMTEEQNSFLAEKLIKRLESVGMRTSYRELYDIFLSRTTNGRPIGIVFRRWKKRGPRSDGTTVPMSARIADEFEWSTDFLQSLSIKCREYEFERKVPLDVDAEPPWIASTRGEAAYPPPGISFLPRPNVDASPSSTYGMSNYLSGLVSNLTTQYSCTNDLRMMKCIETMGVSDATLREEGIGGEQGGILLSSAARQLRMKKLNTDADDFLSNRTLCSLVEQSMGLIFLRRVRSSERARVPGANGSQGSGFAVVRKAGEGSWSAPCFLSVLGSKDRFTDGPDGTESKFVLSCSPPGDDVKMIVIRKKDLVNNLILGNAVKFAVWKEERANVLVRDAAVIGVQNGRFQLVVDDFFLVAKVNDVQNQGAYSLSTDYIEASDILTGTISPPEQSVDFYGALQSLELPYSMHSHPVIPEMLQRQSDSDWVEFLPDHESNSESESCGMRTKLRMISCGSSLEDKREIDIFVRKFKYYLMDGVPVHRILPSSSSKGGPAGLTEEKVLRLTIKDPAMLFSSCLELERKRRPGVSNVGIPSNFFTSFENVTKLSRTPPASWLGVALADDLDEEERKRFFSIETDLSPGPVMMLAKSKKDAMILLCGLKLLLEREKMFSHQSIGRV